MNSISRSQDPIVPRQYDAWARVYDVLWRRYMNKTLPVLQDAAQIQPGERVFDLACGTGELERRIVEATPDVELVGVDLAPAMVDRARSKIGHLPHVSFLKADAHDLHPFADASFDVVVSANTFHYFTHPERVLMEAARVLRPGGRLVVLDWCRDYWACQLMDAVLPWVDPAYQHCYTVDEMHALVEAAPLTYRNAFRYRFDLVWGMMVIEATRTATD